MDEIETPTLPIPGWIAAAEVYRQSSLDESLRRFVEAFNRESTGDKIILGFEGKQYHASMHPMQASHRIAIAFSFQ